jgi:hypothetical protein
MDLRQLASDLGPVWTVLAEERRDCKCPTCYYARQQRRRWTTDEQAELQRRIDEWRVHVENGRMLSHLSKDVDALRHHLPWLLQACLPNPLPYRFEDLFRAMAAAWDRWEPAQVAALETFLLLHWQRIVASSWEMEDLIRSLSLLGRDITPYLDHWLRADRPEAVRSLAGLIAHDGVEAVQGTYASWDRYPAGAAQLARWLRDERTLRALEDQFFCVDEDEQDVKEVISDACTTLRWIQTQP